jgi:hypothetical protein
LEFEKDTVVNNSICVIREILNALCLVMFGVKKVDKIRTVRDWINCDSVQRAIWLITQKDDTQLQRELYQFELCSGIQADIAQISDSMLHDYLYDKLERARSNTLKMLKRLIKIATTLHQIRSYQDIVLKYYPDFLMDYMDLHVLVCVFRSHKPTAILYVGNIHANQYRRDLQELGFEVVRSYSNRNRHTCVRSAH